MSNSPLVKYTKLSPNYSAGRKHAIDTVTIHCVVGHCSLETLGNVFAPTSRQASSNYGVDDNGNIGMYVEEKNRSWCSSNSANDNRAVTIEVASDTTAPYKVTDKALAGVIELCTDICKRNGIKALLWKGDKNLVGQVDKQNMTVHRWFANKSCPGDYLYSRMEYIADEVNKRLGATTVKPLPVPNPPESSGTSFKVGDKVRCKSGVTKYSNGTVMAAFVPNSVLYVRAVEQGGAVLLISTEPRANIYTGRVNASDVEKM